MASFGDHAQRDRTVSVLRKLGLIESDHNFSPLRNDVRDPHRSQLDRIESRLAEQTVHLLDCVLLTQAASRDQSATDQGDASPRRLQSSEHGSVQRQQRLCVQFRLDHRTTRGVRSTRDERRWQVHTAVGDLCRSHGKRI